MGNHGILVNDRSTLALSWDHPAMSYWSVVQTEPQREHMVRLLLMRAGFETYLPRIKFRSRIALLFPAYVFVRIAERFYPVIWTAHVVRLLMAGDQPAHLPDEIIREIRNRERSGFVQLPTRSKILKKGQNVRIANGSFMGHIGLYDGMTSHERARVLLELLGRKVPVEISETDFVPLDVVREAS
jgi:transcriptional antiterminator RfaH